MHYFSDVQSKGFFSTLLESGSITNAFSAAHKRKMDLFRKFLKKSKKQGSNLDNRSQVVLAPLVVQQPVPVHQQQVQVIDYPRNLKTQTDVSSHYDYSSVPIESSQVPFVPAQTVPIEEPKEDSYPSESYLPPPSAPKSDLSSSYLPPPQPQTTYDEVIVQPLESPTEYGGSHVLQTEYEYTSDDEKSKSVLPKKKKFYLVRFK